MIGGVDVKITCGENDSTLEIGVRVLLKYWPQAVFDSPETGIRYNRFAEIPFDGIKKIIVYQNPLVAKQWDDFGAVSELANSMIYFIHDRDALFLSFAERNSFTAKLVDSIQAAFYDELAA